MTTPPADRDRDRRIAALRRARPRSRFLRWSLALLTTLLVSAWCIGGFDLASTFSAQRAENLDRFLSDVRPFDLQGGAWDWSVVGAWVSRKLADEGWEAVINTLAISVLAVVIAALASVVFSFAAARNFATPQPFAPSAAPPSWLRQGAWRGVVAGTRLLLILLRSLPEYVLAFLIMSMLGSPAWPAVLALAIHNTGILGRLNAEAIENVERKPLVALRALGAGRTQLAAVGILPAILPRLLLYFFYRWETCVREATVLGILGLASLGYLIDEAQVAFRYDDMVLYIVLGVVIVMAGDVVSAVARGLVRRAS